MRKDNKILVDINKVQWAKFFFRNQHGQIRNIIDRNTLTCRGVQLTLAPAYSHPDYPGETEIARAKRLDIVDVWQPVLRMKLTANEFLEYTGEKALTLWEVWKAKIYGNK